MSFWEDHQRDHIVCVASSEMRTSARLASVGTDSEHQGIVCHVLSLCSDCSAIHTEHLGKKS